MLTRILRHSFMFAAAGTLAAQTPIGATTPNTKEAAATKRQAPTEPFPNLGLLLRDDDASVLNELWVLGRYHGQYYWSDASDAHADGYENRRFRLGSQMRLFKNLTVHAQAVSGNENGEDFGSFDPEYNGFTELWAGWRFDESFMLTVGQQKHRFTHDRNVSSRYINTLERSLLTNMFRADYTPAITGSGRIGAWSYYTGVFSNATGRDMGTSFTELESGYSAIGSLTRDLGTSLGTDTAFWNVSAVSSDANENATNLNVFDTGMATALILTEGACSLVTEATTGLESSRGDAYAINVQPGWFLTDKWQLVGRYQGAFGDGDDVLQAQKRYERIAVSDDRDNPISVRGDEYHAGYLGLNHYIAGYRVKVMYGVEYSTMAGEEWWTASVMFRVFFGPHSRGPFPMGDTLPGTFF